MADQYKNALTEFIRHVKSPIDTAIAEYGIVDEVDKLKTYAHVLINSLDVPKDAKEGNGKKHIKSRDWVNLQPIIRRLYYVAPLNFSHSPGTKGIDHIIENIFKKDVNMEKRINFPMEIPPSSAHGIPLHVDLDSLGLQYIFRDSGRSITKFLGDSAARFEYSSPTNFIDTAPVDTTKMNKEFLNKPIITIASPDTLKRFGFKLTTGINMYNRSAGGSFPQVKDVTIPQNTVYLITFDINGSAIPGVTPISNPIVMAFDRDHVQIDIEEYRRAYAISFNPGNDAKNERIKILLDAEEDNRTQIFLKYFLIEVKLLGDTNHCMFSRELIRGTAAPSQLVGGESIMPFNPTPTYRNIAFGTCDYDLTLRFILEGVNVFYKEGVCTKYYTGKMMNPFERLIYINENTMSLIHKFKEYLEHYRTHTVINLFSSSADGAPFNYSVIMSYINSLLLNYNNILTEIRTLRRFRGGKAQQTVITKCIFTSPVVSCPNLEKRIIEWNAFGKRYFDTSNFQSIFIESNIRELDEKRPNNPNVSNINRKMNEWKKYINLAREEEESDDGDIMTGGGGSSSSSSAAVAASLGVSSSSSSAAPTQRTYGAKRDQSGEIRGLLSTTKAVLGVSRGIYSIIGGHLDSRADPYKRQKVGGGQRKNRKQYGGALKGYSMNGEPGLITYIVITEFRDILKFGLAVYLCFYNRKETDLGEFFYLTQSEDGIHMLIDVISSGKTFSQIGKVEKLEPAPEQEIKVEGGADGEGEMLVGGGGAGGAGGAGGGEAASASSTQPVAEAVSESESDGDFEKNKYYDNLTYDACRFALHGVMYFKETYNASFSEFDEGKLKSLLRIIVAILDLQEVSVAPTATPSAAVGGGAGPAEGVAVAEGGLEELEVKYKIFEILRRDGDLESDLTESRDKHLRESSQIFGKGKGKGRGYKDITKYLNNILSTQNQTGGFRKQIGGAGEEGEVGEVGKVGEGGDEQKEEEEGDNSKAFELLNLHESKVSELLHVFSLYENVLTMWGERRNVNIVDVIYDYCSEAGEEGGVLNVVSEAAAGALDSIREATGVESNPPSEGPAEREAAAAGAAAAAAAGKETAAVTALEQTSQMVGLPPMIPRKGGSPPRQPFLKTSPPGGSGGKHYESEGEGEGEGSNVGSVGQSNSQSSAASTPKIRTGGGSNAEGGSNVEAKTLKFEELSEAAQEGQAVQAGQTGKEAQGGSTAGKGRKYDNHKSRRNSKSRKARNPTRKL